MEQLQAIKKPSFSGHETFPLRHGWLEKAYHAVAKSSTNPFLEDKAISEFGVGKNMVSAIKYWSLATGFIQPKEEGLEVSALSEALIGRGADPYLETTDSIWKLHFELVRNSKNTTAHWFFSYFNENVFDRTLVLTRIKEFLRLNEIKLPAEKTLLTDVNVTLANYCSPSSINRREDDIGSPLSELNLVRRGEDNRYLLNFGTKKSLSPELFLECLVNFWEYETVRLDQNINSFKLSSLLHEPLSPGRIFLLDERELTERLEAIEEISEGALIWSETAGISEVRRTHHYDRDKLLTKWLSKL